MLAANVGLALFGEFAQGLGLHRWLEQEMPLPGSRRGYEAVAYVEPLVLILTGGGRSLEDLRTLKNDAALATLLKLDTLVQHRCIRRLAAPHWCRRRACLSGSHQPTHGRPPA